MKKLKGLTRQQTSSIVQLLQSHLIDVILKLQRANFETRHIEEISLAFNQKSKQIGGVFFYNQLQTYFIFDPISNQYQPFSNVDLSDYVFLIKHIVCEEVEVFEEHKCFFSKTFRVTFESWDDLLENMHKIKAFLYGNIQLVYKDIVKSYPKSFRAEKIAEVLNS